MTRLREFTVSPPRPLPVILLADVSGSMEADDKISVLNRAVREMIRSFVEEDDRAVEIQVAVITFGGERAQIHQELRPAADLEWRDMDAQGRTPMGAAFALAEQMLEDPQQVPGRAYAPTLVLISDGIPTDDWEGPLHSLRDSDRAQKATRFAMAIGGDADVEMLRNFLGTSQNRVFQAHEAREIKKFLQWVTMSVTYRSRSVNPNIVEPTDFDDFDF